MNRSNRAGSALLLAVVAFLVLAGAGTAFFSLTMAGHRSSLTASNGERAFHLAESGVEDAISRLAAYAADPGAGGDASAIGTTKTVDGVSCNSFSGAMNRGTWTVTVDPPYAGAGSYRIRSTGEIEGERRGVELWVVAESGSGGAAYGLFGDLDVTMSGTVFSDSYQSGKGTYASQALNKDSKSGKTYAGAKGSVGSNQAITVSGNVTVMGDVTPGPGKTLTSSGSVSISGSTTPASSPRSMPAVTYSPSLSSSGALSMSGKSTQTLSAGSHRFDSISMTAQTQLDISGDVVLYVDGDFSVSGQAVFNVPAGSSLTIHHGSGSMSLTGGGLVNTSALPKNVSIHSATTGTIAIAGNSAFYGVVDAPKAELKPSGTTDLYGAFVVKTVKISGTAVFHYDEDLGAVADAKLAFSVKSSRQFVPKGY